MNMEDVQKKKIEQAERDTAFNEWKKKVLSLQVGEEIDITCNKDRAMEGNIQAWAYRQKDDGLFFRRETRSDKVIIIRDK